jgi:hypothetical protein
MEIEPVMFGDQSPVYIELDHAKNIKFPEIYPIA